MKRLTQVIREGHVPKICETMTVDYRNQQSHQKRPGPTDNMAIAIQPIKIAAAAVSTCEDRHLHPEA